MTSQELKLGLGLGLDAKICRIKELYRTVRSRLAYRLPGSLVPDLVAYAVARLNIHRTSALTEVVAPKGAFTGIPVCTTTKMYVWHLEIM
jgi:hypothetical protein